MRILIDTNVFLDVLQQRGDFYAPALTVLTACRDRIVQGGISAQSVADLFYILRKDYSSEERRKILLDICQIMDVESVDKGKLIFALRNEAFSDFEDCLQAECAEAWGAAYIITRNGRHFTSSTIPAITPKEFCSRYLENHHGA
ncbi:MAG: PIN domain-containing protein [Schwartzia sp.]|nr:PIN domain-containing protein [Schwartzia sp. (in: firmicutes)]